MIVFARMSLAFVMLAAFLLATGRKSLFRVKPRDLPLFAGAAVSSAIILNVFYSMSTVMNPLSVASILLATSPVFVVLLSAPLFKEKITAAKTRSLIIVFGGCVLTSGIVGDGVSAAVAAGVSGVSPQGLATGALAGFGWALYGIMTRFCLNRGYSSLTVNLYTFLIGSLVCVPFTDFGVIASSIAGAPIYMTLMLMLHTFATSLLPYALFTYGMTCMDTGKASIIASVEPVAATVLGFLLYGEKPDFVTAIGIALVIFGIALLNFPDGGNPFRRRFRP
jgi:drug/metabolite transporter (DMT)-like permease